MPLTIVGYLKVQMLAFGQNRFRIGSPINFTSTRGATLQTELQGVRPRGFNLCQSIKREPGISSAAMELKL